jgi:glyoxylase-like metal-dependent hydrolase (beta-lactamase superfamily II)
MDQPLRRTFEAASGITAIDTMMVGRAGVTAAYVIDAPAPALVETGPSASLPALLSALDELGVGPNDLAHVIVSHIHLDHAGGAGALLEHFPRATVWAHHRGAPHMADPARLVASTIRSYGEEAVRRMFGPVAPVPAERLRGLADGDRIELGGRSILAIDAPGHSNSELFLVDSATGALFTGDGFGILLPDVGILRPAAPAPEFDLEHAVASIRRVQATAPSVLLFSHFGPAPDVQGVCDTAVERLKQWTDAVRIALQRGVEPAAIADVLRELTAKETRTAMEAGLDVARYEYLSSYELNAGGIVRYLTKGPPRPVPDRAIGAT